jgi:hypothetical protein
MTRNLVLLLLLLLLPFLVGLIGGGCKSSGKVALPAGKGLVTADREPPAGAETFEVPAWKVGDRFVYQKGGFARLAFRLESTTDGVHRLVDEQTGFVTLVGEDLSDRGQEKPGSPELTLRFDPADFDLSWPLWVGKRWACHCVRRAAGEEDVPLLISYECDGIDTVKVPAGTFRCLRIWRRARPAADGRYVDRVSIAWYAPEVGAIVRRLNESLLTEAVEIDRQ